MNDLVNGINDWCESLIEIINREKFSNSLIDRDMCVGLLLDLFKRFFDGNVNVGIYMIIFSDKLICDRILDVVFNNKDNLLSLVGNEIRINNSIDLFYKEDGCNYINLESDNILISFNDNWLEVLYDGDKDKEIKYVFNDMCLVSEKIVCNKFNTPVVNGIKGYECINRLVIKRNNVDLSYVIVSNEIEIVLDNRIISSYDRRCGGYINSKYFFDLGDISELNGKIDEINLDDVSFSMINRFFPNMEKVLIDNVSKKKSLNRVKNNV